MKEFFDIAFDNALCAQELLAFRQLLAPQMPIPERTRLLPFFQAARQLSAFIGTYVPDIGPAPLVAYEFQIAGDFAADLVVGKRDSETFCLVEFEDAAPDSILAAGGRSLKHWSRRFEQGFSQLVDWFYALDDLKGTAKFGRHFGYGHARFHGLLVIGRSADLSPDDRRRIRWRSERVLVDSHPIHCVTYDELLEHLQRRLLHYPAAAPADPAR